MVGLTPPRLFSGYETQQMIENLKGELADARLRVGAPRTTRFRHPGPEDKALIRYWCRGSTSPF
jgi:hypothetical protein